MTDSGSTVSRVTVHAVTEPSTYYLVPVGFDYGDEGNGRTVPAVGDPQVVAERSATTWRDATLMAAGDAWVEFAREQATFTVEVWRSEDAWRHKRLNDLLGAYTATVDPE